MFGWQVHECMEMPVKTFFSVLNAARKIKNEQRWSSYLELCDIASIPMCTPEYVKKLKDFYYMKLMDREHKNVSGPVFDMSNKEDASRATNLLKGIFKQKAKLEGLH